MGLLGLGSQSSSRLLMLLGSRLASLALGSRLALAWLSLALGWTRARLGSLLDKRNDPRKSSKKLPWAELAITCVVWGAQRYQVRVAEAPPSSRSSPLGPSKIDPDSRFNVTDGLQRIDKDTTTETHPEEWFLFPIPRVSNNCGLCIVDGTTWGKEETLDPSLTHTEDMNKKR